MKIYRTTVYIFWNNVVVHVYIHCMLLYEYVYTTMYMYISLESTQSKNSICYSLLQYLRVLVTQ